MSMEITPTGFDITPLGGAGTADLGLERIGVKTVLGVDYATFRDRSSSVELVLTHDGVNAINQKPGFNILLNHVRDHMANDLGYDRAVRCDPTRPGKLQSYDILGMSVKDVGIESGFGEVKQPMTTIATIVPEVEITSYGPPKHSRTTAAVAMHTTAWLGKTLKNAPQPETGKPRLRAALQYGQVTSLLSGNSVVISEMPSGEEVSVVTHSSRFPLGPHRILGESSLTPAAQVRQQVGQSLRSAIGRRGMALMTSGGLAPRHYMDNSHVEGDLFNNPERPSTPSYDGVTITLSHQPNTSTRLLTLAAKTAQHAIELLD